MFQQRVRRFRSVVEKQHLAKLEQRYRKLLLRMGYEVPNRKVIRKFDSNNISPGTKFMYEICEKIIEWAEFRFKLAKNPKCTLQVIVSGVGVPGEGEQKIVHWMRNRRQESDYDPNTTHCLVGQDADFIILSLALHDPHIFIYRGGDAKKGSDIREDDGSEAGSLDENSHGHVAPLKRKNLEVLSMYTVRQVLSKEFVNPNLSRPLDMERVFDDLVFIFTLFGNDFIPALPFFSLKVSEGDDVKMFFDSYRELLYETYDEETYLLNRDQMNLSLIFQYFEKLEYHEHNYFLRRGISLDPRRRNDKKSSSAIEMKQWKSNLNIGKVSCDTLIERSIKEFDSKNDVVVKNLPPDMRSRADEVRTFFSRYGKIVKVNLTRKGYIAFVRFTDEAGVRAACGADGFTINNYTMRISRANVVKRNEVTIRPVRGSKVVSFGKAKGKKDKKVRKRSPVVLRKLGMGMGGKGEKGEKKKRSRPSFSFKGLKARILGSASEDEGRKFDREGIRQLEKEEMVELLKKAAEASIQTIRFFPNLCQVSFETDEAAQRVFQKLNGFTTESGTTLRVRPSNYVDFPVFYGKFERLGRVYDGKLIKNLAPEKTEEFLHKKTKEECKKAYYEKKFGIGIGFDGEGVLKSSGGRRRKSPFSSRGRRRGKGRVGVGLEERMGRGEENEEGDSSEEEEEYVEEKKSFLIVEEEKKYLSQLYELMELYFLGLQWVMSYYFGNTCPSWRWYYPYHYAPFLEDVLDFFHWRLDVDPADELSVRRRRASSLMRNFLQGKGGKKKKEQEEEEEEEEEGTEVFERSKSVPVTMSDEKKKKKKRSELEQVLRKLTNRIMRKNRATKKKKKKKVVTVVLNKEKQDLTKTKKVKVKSEKELEESRKKLLEQKKKLVIARKERYDKLEQKIEGFFRNTKDEPYKPLENLVLILPIQSAKSLPESYQKIIYESWKEQKEWFKSEEEMGKTDVQSAFSSSSRRRQFFSIQTKTIQKCIDKPRFFSVFFDPIFLSMNYFANIGKRVKREWHGIPSIEMAWDHEKILAKFKDCELTEEEKEVNKFTQNILLRKKQSFVDERLATSPNSLTGSLTPVGNMSPSMMSPKFDHYEKIPFDIPKSLPGGKKYNSKLLKGIRRTKFDRSVVEEPVVMLYSSQQLTFKRHMKRYRYY